MFSVNSTSCCFTPDTLSISILTLSVLGFFILFSVATFLATRENTMFSEKSAKDIERSMTDPIFRLLASLASPLVINTFVISALLYLGTLLLCLINYYANLYILLYINLSIVLITTGALFFVLCKSIFKVYVLTPKDIKKYFEDMKWLESKNKP